MSFANIIIYGSLAELEQALKAGADSNALDEYGFYPIIEAAIVNDADKAKLLLRYGADVNQADVTGRTALHWAADNNNSVLCQLLLEHKANANAYTFAGQSVLVYPLLREQLPIKKLLYQHGADLSFAQDFINTKLLGHRYELKGYVDIVDHAGRFVELDYDGFFLEFTLSIIRHSLERFVSNYAAKKLRPYFGYLKTSIECYATASQLLYYQQYTLNIQEHATKIDALLERELLMIPIAYEGHAVALIKYKNFLIKCDRGENSKTEGTVIIYRIHNMGFFNKQFVKQLLYQRQSKAFIHNDINRILALETLGQLPVSAQIIGNCSWANIEAAMPALVWLQLMESTNSSTISSQQIKLAMRIFNLWEAWDRDRALEDCMQSFASASKARKASKAAVLGAILFQKCYYGVPKHARNAEKILEILTIPEYLYILQSYVQIFWKNQRTIAGKNLIQLLDDCAIKLPS